MASTTHTAAQNAYVQAGARPPRSVSAAGRSRYSNPKARTIQKMEYLRHTHPLMHRGSPE